MAKNGVNFPPPLLEKIRSYDNRNSFFHCFCYGNFAVAKDMYYIYKEKRHDRIQGFGEAQKEP